MCWRTCSRSGNRAGRKTEGGPRRLVVAGSRSGARSDCLAFKQTGKTIKPQYAMQRLEELTKDRDRYICTEVGQHQMWAAQYMGFEAPNRWMTSAGWAPWAMASRPRSACRWRIPTRW